VPGPRLRRAAGVLLYTLVVGGFPWEVAHTQDAHFAKAAADTERGPCRAALDASGHGACSLSAPLVALLDAMLCANPSGRIAIDEVAAHGWMTAPPALATPQDSDVDFRSDAAAETSRPRLARA